MGNHISGLIDRLFDYPIKRRPLCFFRQEDYASTGEPLEKEGAGDDKGEPSEYDKLVDTFYTRLLSQRKQTKEVQERNRRWMIQKKLKQYPGWNEMTIANLQNLFLMFDNGKNGMFNYNDFCAAIESLGDQSSIDYRKRHFELGDTDMDGWISFDEFLKIVYYFNGEGNELGEMTGLPKMCFEIAENIRFVSGLSFGEQLEYGLF